MKLTRTMLEEMSTEDLKKLEKIATERSFLIQRLSRVDWPMNPTKELKNNG